MSHMRAPARLLVALVLVLAAGLVALGEPAWAHVRRVEAPAVTTVEPVAIPPATTQIVAASPAPPSLWPLLALVPLGALAVAAPRRALGLALIALLSIFAAESAVHSVHHLADQQAAAQCVVSVASAHLHGATPDAPDDGISEPAVVGAVSIAKLDRPGARFIRPDEGRAPPA